MKFAKISFAPKHFDDAVVRTVIAKAESACCSPAEALRLLLNESAYDGGTRTLEPARDTSELAFSARLTSGMHALEP